MTRGAGFDMGSRSSLVAARIGDVPTNLPSTLTATTVSFGASGTYQVGVTDDDAPGFVVRDLRRRLGTEWSITADDRTFTSQEVAARLLRRLKVEAESVLDDRITYAVVTVPASYVEPQRQATKEAAQIAGLGDVVLINDSSAAALGYGASGDEGLTLVICLGGGYLSVAVSEQGDGVVEIKTTRGEHDPALFKTPPSAPADLVPTILRSVTSCVEAAGIEPAAIGHVVLVGDATHTTGLREAIAPMVDQRGVIVSGSVDLVAVGAAMFAGIRTGEFKDALLLDVSAHTVGLETKGGVMTPLIARDTTVPTRRTEIFTTAEDNQPSVEVRLFQGESPLTKDNTSIGTFELTGLSPAPASVPRIEVTFDIDASAMAHVSAKDLGSGLTQAIDVTGGTALSVDDMARMSRELVDDEEASRAGHSVGDLPGQPPDVQPDDQPDKGPARNADVERDGHQAPATEMDAAPDATWSISHADPEPSGPRRPTSGVFISYRRDDAGAVAGRLSDRLTDRLSDGSVFMDVDSIEPGLDFQDVISDAISHCQVLLVLIGEGWLAAEDDRGRKRLEDPDDVVRIEIQSALDRGIRVIPVLVEAAAMPYREELPEPIASLARRNAARLRHETFRADALRLIEIVERVIHDET